MYSWRMRNPEDFLADFCVGLKHPLAGTLSAISVIERYQHPHRDLEYQVENLGIHENRYRYVLHPLY